MTPCKPQVLDDVWDPKHEKPLNCIDNDNASRLLVTTRIRGLLKNSAELDLEAVQGEVQNASGVANNSTIVEVEITRKREQEYETIK